jgi:hypothetical protein
MEIREAIAKGGKAGGNQAPHVESSIEYRSNDGVPYG